MSKISDRVLKIKSSGIRKFFDLVKKEKDIISLGIGEPDFETPEKIKDAAIRAIENSLTTYTSNYGLYELREKISKKLKRENNIDADPEKEILITTGSSEALDLALRAIINPNDEVLIPEPCYVAYKSNVILCGGIPIPIPCCEENEFRVNVEDIEKKISKKTKCIILATPNNPTGSILRENDLRKIADI
ncbi:MAG: pyridoxal phosphate-dependent aminotransferase, partial [Candidatus Altarchaeaceae archaeon]